MVLCCSCFMFAGVSVSSAIQSRKVANRKKSVAALIFTSNASFFDREIETKRGLCRWLRGLKSQNQMCRRKKGLPELLQETRKLTLSSCQAQFEYEQWNCSTTNMKKFFKRIYRETAFMYSLATSAFTYLVAKACAGGKLANCKCAAHGKSGNVSKWDWGGCGDNTKEAVRFTKKFLQLNKKGDNPGNVLRYNSEVGMKVVLRHEEKHCKCHGVSGSCSTKICFKRLKPFAHIAQDLKRLYHGAIQAKPDNNVRDLMEHRKRRNLVFLENFPSFCDPRGGVSTVGRRCKDVDNCATLCCSRGYDNSTRIVYDKCDCRWRNDTVLQIVCDQCRREEILFTCK